MKFSNVFQYQPLSTINYLIKTFITNPQLRVAVKTLPLARHVPLPLGQILGKFEWDTSQ